MPSSVIAESTSPLRRVSADRFAPSQLFCRNDFPSIHPLSGAVFFWMKGTGTKALMWVDADGNMGVADHSASAFQSEVWSLVEDGTRVEVHLIR